MFMVNMGRLSLQNNSIMNKDIISTTLHLLAENTEWEERYAKYIRRNLIRKSSKRPFNKPEGLSLYSSVSGYKGQTYDLRFDGQSVGIVSCSTEGVMLYPRNENNKKYVGLDLDKEKYKWVSTDATQFRKHFKDLANSSVDIKLKSPEHRVENRLLKEFSKRTRAEGKALCNIQPITLYGCYFQMPTPIKASEHHPEYAKQYGGGIDILARVKSSSGESRICVMEVKDENKPSESQSAAMEQALTYAIFIARLLRSKSGQEWWDFFMDREFVSKTIPDKIDIDVVTIMPQGETEEYCGEGIEVKELSTVLHCHSLYYNHDDFKEGYFNFSGTYISQLRK